MQSRFQSRYSIYLWAHSGFFFKVSTYFFVVESKQGKGGELIKVENINITVDHIIVKIIKLFWSCIATYNIGGIYYFFFALIVQELLPFW